MSEEQLVLIISDYVYDTYGIPCNFHSFGKTNSFEKSCYMRWASDELINYIHSYSGNPYDALKHFNSIMLDFSKRKNNEIIFKTASQLSAAIINICSAAGWDD